MNQCDRMPADRTRGWQNCPERLERVVHRVLATAAIAAAGAAGTFPAHAQQAATPSANIEEVTVTATRVRPENQTSATGLQLALVDTPQSITVVTPELLKLIGASSVYEASDWIPGLQASGSGYGLDRILLRGVVIGGHRVNGTRFRSTRSLDGFAMERIEVVRGPATALYGASGSFGGEINNILKSPTSSPQALVGLVMGDFDRSEVELDLSGPVGGTGDRISGRFAGNYREYGTPIEVVDIENYREMLSGSLRFELSDSTTANIWAYYDKINEDPYDGAFMQTLPDGTLTLPDIPAGDQYFSDPRYSQLNQDQLFVIANVEHRLANDWQFKVQGAYTEVDVVVQEYYPFGPAGAYDLADDEVYFYSYNQERSNQEMTFDASLGGTFEAGGREQQFFALLEYASDVNPAENLLLNSLYLGNIKITEGGRGILADGSPVPLVDKSTLGRRLLTGNGYTDFRASFQFLLAPTEKVDLLLGVLYQDSEVESSTLIRGGVVRDPPTIEVDHYDKWVSRAGVTYHLVEDRGSIDALNTYFSYSEAFNPNFGVRDPDGNALTTPQEMRQYEIGLKGEFLNGALGGAIAYFDTETTNLPVSAVYLGGFGGNAGSTLVGVRDISGIELEVLGQIRPEINVVFNYSYTDSEYRDPNFDFTVPVNNVPEHQGGLLASYEFLEGPARGLILGGSVYVMGDFSYVPSLGNVERFGQYTGGSNTRIGLSASYKVQADWGRGLQFYFNANNITGEEVYILKEDHPGFGVTREYAEAYTFGIRYAFGQ
jgi:outer membrane receptor for ferric coprogen and ferric-rhodotorulic acid